MSHPWLITAALLIAIIAACLILDRVDRHRMRNRCWLCGVRQGQPHLKGCLVEAPR